MSDALRFTETFTSIQGEGMLVGIPSFFIRLHGCNLSCSWCDTPEARQDSSLKSIAVDELDGIILDQPCEYVVITGGEPLLQSRALMPLLQEFYPLYHITLETNGTIYPDVPVHVLVALLSISPKLHVSDWSVVHRLLADVEASPGTLAQVKVVVGTQQELVDAIAKLELLYQKQRSWGGKACFILQPESSRGVEWIRHVVDFVCRQRVHVPLRVIPQVHKLIAVR